MPLFTPEEIAKNNSLNQRDSQYQAQFQSPSSPSQPHNTSNMAQTMASRYSSFSTPQMPQQSDYRDILNTVRSKLAQPPKTYQYNADTDQTFQAAANAVRQNVGTAQANTNARLRANGQGKSSWSDTVANQIAQQAEANIANQIRPQYEQMAYSRFQNEQNAERQNMNDLLTVGQGFNTLEQQAFQNALARAQENRAEAALTGRMQLPEVAQNYINQILDLKRQAEGQGVSQEQMGQYRSQADALRQQLAMTGVNPDIVGYESDYNQAMRNVAQGTPTLEARRLDRQVSESDRNFDYQKGRDAVGDQRYAQEFDYRKARDQIMDERDKRNFDEDYRRYGLDYALKKAAQANAFANSAADNARANASLNLQRERFNWERDPNNPEYQYKQAQVGKLTSQVDPKHFESEVVTNLNKMTPEQQQRFFDDEAGTLINSLGLTGMNRIYNQYFDKEGNPKRK
ncbi:hypothetical protein [Paenibacillus oleatilyticus]|uniref:Uncharacterized protein n=1 Tax=Paenibacillus oleatilyticus TaxID=2594886 RepID=A0ABV4VCI8_9BACL